MKDKNETRGYLKKLKNSTLTRMFGATNLRWFEFSQQANQFGYKEVSTDKDFINYVFIKEITDYNENLTDQEKNFCEWKFGFKVISKTRSFTLYAQSQNERIKWKKIFDILLNRILIEPPKVEKPAVIKELPMKNPSPPKIDYDEIERQERLEKLRRMKEEEERRRRLLEEEEERRKRKEEKEIVIKKGFYDDIGVTVTNYEKNVEKTIHFVEIGNGKKDANSGFEHGKEERKDDFIVNEKEFDDWNYYNLEGNLIDEEKNCNKSKFVGYQNKPKPIKKEVDYESFKRSLFVENLHDDRYAREKENEEKQRKKEEEEWKKEEEERIKKEFMEEVRIQQEKERELSMRSAKGIEKIRMEIDQKKSLKEKYAPHLDTDKKTKYSLYENISLVSGNRVNLKVEGVDLTKRADPKYLKNDLNQPYNIVGDKLGMQKNNYKPLKAISVDKTQIKKNLENSNVDFNRPIDESTINVKVNNFSSSLNKNRTSNKKSTSPDPVVKKVVVPATFNEFMNDINDFETDVFRRNNQSNNNQNFHSKENLKHNVTQGYEQVQNEQNKQMKKKVGMNNMYVPFGEEGDLSKTNGKNGEFRRNDDTIEMNKPKKTSNNVNESNSGDNSSLYRTPIQKKKEEIVEKNNERFGMNSIQRDASPVNFPSATSKNKNPKEFELNQQSDSLKKAEQASPEKRKNSDVKVGQNAIVMDDD